MIMKAILSFHVPLLAVGVLMVTTPAAGQIGDPVETECTCLEDVQERAFRVMAPAMRALEVGLTRHARLGVILGERSEVSGRTGVRLDEVTEGSPAERAGLREGDVVVAVDGNALGREPASSLMERMADVEPGDTVEITFFRGSDERTARAVAEAAPGMRVFRPATVERMERMANRMAHGRAAATVRAPELRRELRIVRSPLGGLELAAVNASLGEYFGTDRGVLVTAVPDGSRLDLRPGDVILAVGDREVRDPAHVRSILASYRTDEPIALRIVRERRTIEVTGQRQ